MPIGIALVLIFVLYLIDKHNRWRQAIKLVVALAVLLILGLGCMFGWQAYETRQQSRQEAEYEAQQSKQVAQKQIDQTKICKDWEDKHPVGSPAHKVYTEQGGLTEKLTNKHFWVLDPPQGCEGPLEADYSARNVWIVVPPNPLKAKPLFGWASANNGLVVINKRCAFNAGSFPCGIGEDEDIARLNEGDRVQLLSDKVRTPNGTDVYEVKFQQWTGWVDANELSLEKAATK